MNAAGFSGHGLATAVRQRPALTDQAFQRKAFSAHQRLAEHSTIDNSLRPLVRASWERSLRHLGPGPAHRPATIWDEQQLREYRERHPLAAIMPVIQQLLIAPAASSGLLVAVGDQRGRLLWVDGDRRLRGLAEEAGFLPGTDWSEAAMGTCAPGTALAIGQGVQIAGAEHFNQIVCTWNCTAVPLEDPQSGELLGVIDISGGSSAVAAHSLALVQAAVTAASTELSLQRLRHQLSSTSRRAPRKAPVPGLLAKSGKLNLLSVLGRDRGLVQSGSRSVLLSERHSELICVLALHPKGLSAEELGQLAYAEATPASTIRAELLRLRRLLQEAEHPVSLLSRPYRLAHGMVLDAQRVLEHLDRGAHRLALAAYPGQLLPRSVAPAVVEFRQRVSYRLREAMLSDASSEVLLRYLELPEAGYDAEAWQTTLKLLPARSPKRAAVVSHLELLRP
ncbi:GAF domain-containing protein [Psychromicrobium sp. YIM B11713]|uniref:GAF domain-containing protein n=1 Tax=Psychromicrobium sp. YIM B11713 TaxID=3145233 RepID=UPI00374EC1FD